MCIAGAFLWKFVSVDGGVEPDVYVSITLMSVLMPVHVSSSPSLAPSLSVIVCIGVEVTFEVITTAALLR